MTVSMDMSELQRWGGMLQREADDVASRLEPAVADQQGVVESRALAAAPRLSGALAGSIRRLGRGLTRRVRAGTKRTYYAAFQEFGTGKMAAHPFLLKQADAATHGEFEGRVGRALDRGQIYQ